jgi:hypothetical protein
MIGINLEVWFSQEDAVTVTFDPLGVPLGEDGSYDDMTSYDTMLFCLFAARQIANLRGDTFATSLAVKLSGIDPEASFAAARELLAPVRVSSRATHGPPHGVKRPKGFTAEFRPARGSFFKLHTHGFGVLSKGIGYYAPTSTLALLTWLLGTRHEDPAYQRALGAAARGIGIAGVEGLLGVRSHTAVAMKTAGAALLDPDAFGDGPSPAPLVAGERDIDYWPTLNIDAAWAQVADGFHEGIAERGATQLYFPGWFVRRSVALNLIEQVLHIRPELQEEFAVVMGVVTTKDARAPDFYREDPELDERLDGFLIRNHLSQIVAAFVQRLSAQE